MYIQKAYKWRGKQRRRKKMRNVNERTFTSGYNETKEAKPICGMK